jgi:PAS domain S-box-containing protein
VLSLEDLARNVIDSGTPSECEVRAETGRVYALRVRPYLALDRKIDGAVVVLVDIDTLKRSERDVVAARDYAEAMLRTARDPLLVLRADLRVNTANDAFYKAFKTTPRQTEGRLFWELAGGVWELPRLRELLDDILRRRSFFDEFAVVREFPHIGRRHLLLNARQLETRGANPGMILLAIEDVTERYQLDDTVRRSEERFRALTLATAHMVWTADARGSVCEDSPAWRAFTGQTFAQWQGAGWLDAVHPDDRAGVMRRWNDSVAAGRMYETEYRLRRADGVYRWTAVRAVPVRTADDSIREWVGMNVDITGQKAASQRIQMSETRYRRLFEASYDGILLLDAETRAIADANLALTELLGYTRDELVGRQLWQVGLLPSESSSRAPFERLAEEGFLQFGDLSIRSRTGARIEVELVSNVYEQDGVRVIQCNVRDITLRKRALAALSESEERYRTLFNSIDEGFCVIEVLFDEKLRAVDYLFLEVNPAFESQSGLTMAVGRRMREMKPDHESYWFDTYGRVASTGEAMRFVNEAKTLGRWFDVYAFRLGGEGSRKVAIVFSDITERRRSEEVQGRLAAIVESSTDAIVGESLDGLVTSWNAGAEALFGFTAGEVLGALGSVIVPPEQQQEEATLREQVLRGGSIAHFETTRREKGGTNVDVSLSISPIRDREGTVVGASKILRDIGAQRSIALELERARDEALAAARAKDEFLAALSHELRTPLTPVLLLASDAAGNSSLSESVRGDFSAIHKNVSLEARLIDDLLDLARIARGKLKVDPKPCDVHGVLQDAIAVVRGDLEEKRIRLSVLPYAERAHVLGDAVRLQQIFWNVLRNAVHFTPQGGSITVVVSTDRTRGELVVEITDTGVGIAAEDLVRIFGTFSQGADEGTGSTRRFGSLGLGLSISRTLVELHAGSISATSAGRGAGSTFAIRLPLLAEEDATPSARVAGIDSWRSAPRVDGLRERILVVEDHAPTRVTLQRLLERRNFLVVTAGSAAEALACAKDAKIDVVIADIGLPDLNGCELMVRLRESDPSIQGLSLSGYGTEIDKAKSQAAGFFEHLVKPVNIDQLDRALENVVDRAAKLRAARP